VYSCYNAFRSKGRHVGTEAEALAMIVSSSADGGSTWRSMQISPADSTGSGPSEWGIAGRTVRTDSHGTVFVFAEMTDNHAITGNPPPQGVPASPLPSHSAHVMFTSHDGSATWTRPQTLFRITDVCAFVDPLSLRCVMDGYTGARTDIGSTPSVDIANGAPTGKDATNLIIDGWSDASAGLNHEQARVSWSADGGKSWHTPTAVSAPTDRPIYTAPAISPSGDRVYVVYEAVTSPWADYVYAAASRDYGVGVWIDARNAQVCPAVQLWRAQSLATGQSLIPAPWPLADCPAGFGNTDA
jgi:hypothetical protein